MFNETEHSRAMHMLVNAGIDGRFSIGIKKLLMIAEMARQDVDKVEKFVAGIQEEAMRTAMQAINMNAASFS